MDLVQREKNRQLINFKEYFNLQACDRLDLNFIFMQTAILFSSRSECQKSQVGCCLVNDGRIISCGYNADIAGGSGCTWDELCPKDSSGSCLKSIHAEQNALMFCAQYGIKTKNAILYTTLSPCISCAKIIVAAGISKVIYLNEYRIIDGLDYLKRANIIVERYL